jgi:hypothetical protein
MRDDLWISDAEADAMLGVDAVLDEENRGRVRVMAADQVAAARGCYAARCPVCTLVCPGSVITEGVIAGLIRLRLHTVSIQACIPADLLSGHRILLPWCIGSKAAMHPYIGARRVGQHETERRTP